MSPRPDPPRAFAAAGVGLAVTVALVVAAAVLPAATGWEVWSRAPRSAVERPAPPLHGWWEASLGPGTPAVLLLALLGWRYGAALASRLPWPALLAATYPVSLAWLSALALVDGTDGIARVLGGEYEYLPTARAVDDVGELLREFTTRIPADADRSWPTHVAGHPPGALLVFVGLVKVGLGGDLAAGWAVTAVAATIPAAVLLTVRALGAEAEARRAAPFLALTPAAVFLAVSADAVFTAVGAWGLAALAAAGRAPTRRGTVTWAVTAGLLLGGAVMMSYGLPLLGPLALAVLVVARRWLPLPVAAAAALALVAAFAPFGFAWWEALPVLRDRYWDGIAADRPAAYWMWANLAALAVCAGPAVGAACPLVVTTLRSPPSGRRVMATLAAAALVAVVLADLSQMSRAEVERIWLPFVPWLTLALVLLPERWHRAALAGQVGWALLVQHLLYTSW